MLQISETRDVVFLDPLPVWAKDGVMSAVPYHDESGWHLLGRGYTEDKTKPVYQSCIFLADGKNPFEFTIRPTPLLQPGAAGETDRLACEDPTRVVSPYYGPGFLYSQVRRIPPQVMMTQGKSAEDLGVYVALGCVFALDQENLAIRTILEPTEQRWWKSSIGMCKEGEVLLRPEQEHDVLLYEFGDCTASRIAVAKVDLCGRGKHAPACSAWDSRLWLDKRPGKWDSDHVSTGPIVDFGKKKLMFYNGRDAQTWAIGEVVFDPLSLEIKYRSEQPLIVPPPEIGWGKQFIAFSSGALVVDGTIYLYHHIADKRIRCAVGRIE